MPKVRLLLLGLCLAAGACDEGTATLSLDGAGGDSWTFRRLVEGTVLSGPCDAVHVTSPAGAFPAAFDGARFAATVHLRAGANDIRAVCLRDGRVRGRSAASAWTVRLEDRPKAWARVLIEEALVRLDAGRSEPAPAQLAPLVRFEWRAHPGNPAPLVSADGASLDAAPVLGERLALSVPAADGAYRLTLTVSDALGRSDASTVAFRVGQGRAQAPDVLRERPSWMDAAVVYGAVPALFGPRGLADVAAHLDRIAALGANVLWLSPVTGAPPGDFGYAVTDHFNVRPALGSEDDLRRLVAAAHARGIRVLLDFVPNHLSERHPYYLAAAGQGAGSPYHGFFARDDAGAATHYFDWTHLKNLNYDSAEVQAYMIAAFARWVRDLDVDGFRVDAS